MDRNLLTARIDALTGIRGLAALWVWLYHTWLVAGNRPVSILGFDITPLVSGGWVGVDLFFVLSGFVLTWPYAINKEKIFVWTEFMRRRALRVIPAYYLQFVILVLVATFFGTMDIPSIGNALAHLLFAHNFNYKWSSAMNDAWWTLPVEWQFYLIFPLLLLIIFRKTGVFPLFLLAASIALFWRIGAMHWINSTYPSAEVGKKVWLLEQLPGRIDQFCVGMCTAFLAAKMRQPAGMTIKLEIYASSFIVAGFVFVFALLYLIADHAVEYWDGHYLLYVWHILCGLALATLILGAALGGRLADVLLSSRPLRALGEISYSIYLWHFSVLVLLVDAGYFIHINGDHYFIKIAMSSTLPVLAVAAISWLVAEKPFLHNKLQSVNAGKNPWPWVAAAIPLIVFILTLGAAYENHMARHMPSECQERGGLDSPLSISRTPSKINVIGWAHDSRFDDPIARIVVASQENVLGSASADLTRPDVRKAFPACRVKKPGFSIKLDLSEIPENITNLSVQVELTSGYRYELGRLNLLSPGSLLAQ